jgi:alanyl-tRNA synthetase
LEEISGKSYDNNTDEMRVIADHIRGAYLLAAEGLVPSNKTQGYAMRRLLRRAILRALDLGIATNFLAEIVPVVSEIYSDLPDSVLTQREKALDVMLHEESAFRKTLNKGLKELHKMAKQSNDNCLSGYDLFKLQDTYGFPMELSVEECYREGIELTKDYLKEFEAALAEQRVRSQTASKGMFKGGLEDHGEQTVKYHTACHLLLAALQKLISPDIVQKGSNITADRVRFDFNLDHKMTPEEKSAVEAQVNEWIAADLPVVFDEYNKAYARDTLKAHGQFWDKYPDILKVYTIGDFDNPISREVCGGPHVEHTGVLGHFKIKKEESSSAGVRRIKAVLE